jgi:hypothetical protein
LGSGKQCFGRMEFWKDGMMEGWNNGILEYWNYGIMECCYDGP